MTRKQKIELIVDFFNDVQQVHIYAETRDMVRHAEELLNRLDPTSKVPTKQEFIDYGVFHDMYSEWVGKVYDIYFDADWCIASGRKIKNWKTTLRNRALNDSNANKKDESISKYRSVI